MALPTPQWFEDALQYPVSNCHASVQGVRIHYLRWQPPQLSPLHTLSSSGQEPQGVVFVHGAGAHAHWWTHIAPMFASEGFDAIALSLSGHGESGERKTYEEETWSEEIYGVCADAGFFRSERSAAPIVVGHSLGSYSVLRCAQRWGLQLGGIVLADSGIPHPYIWNSREENEAVRQMSRPAAGEKKPLRVHPKSRPVKLTLSPPQRVRNPYILEHIASKSWVSAIRPDDGEEGWRWSFDPHRAARSDFINSIQIGSYRATCSSSSILISPLSLKLPVLH